MSRIITCYNCSTRIRVSELITDKTLICPHCLWDVDNPQPEFQIQIADINTDVKRDLSIGSIVLAVLTGFCVLGIAITLCVSAPVKKGDRSIYLLMFSCAALDLLASIAIIGWGISGNRGSSARGCSIAFLVLGTIVAIAIFGFITCAVEFEKSWEHGFH